MSFLTELLLRGILFCLLFQAEVIDCVYTLPSHLSSFCSYNLIFTDQNQDVGGEIKIIHIRTDISKRKKIEEIRNFLLS